MSAEIVQQFESVLASLLAHMLGKVRRKARRMLDDARMAERWSQEKLQQAREPPPPHCICRFDYYRTEIVICSEGRGEPHITYCRDCAPDHVLAIIWPTAENDAMCNDYERQIAAAQAIRYMENMKDAPPFTWKDGRIPNNADEPQPHIRIHDNGFILRLTEKNLEGSMTRWAWDQGKKPVYNFRSEGRDFSKSERCLIMATAFYEYTEPAPAKPKVKLKDQHRFTIKNQPFFWIAGIVINSCFAMLTTELGVDVRPYHDRQVVVLPPMQGLEWLQTASSELLSPAPPRSLAHTITRQSGIELLV